MKLDLLMIAAHPDDAELGCAGTLLRHAAAGRRVGVVDLTRGELGTRGSAALRDQEAQDAAHILGLSVRENLRMRDGFFANDEAHQLRIVEVIRRFQPEIILTNPNVDRHPDHGRAADLVHDAAFLAGLTKLETHWDGVPQTPWRPRLLLQAIHHSYVRPDLVVDVTAFWDQKLAALTAFKSQFYHPEYSTSEAHTPISTPCFLHVLEARGQELGSYIGATYGEGFTCRRPFGLNDLFLLQ
ncbi:bacillithiol biosynthesis deacetylase BshB1 [Hymenobacter sp. GOD-10R]|uniref:bacillithiol biosynthesis deacetylase BshB1 n=1 Tax=Hymenobacter sp. GOD-10R TaxID=3093922 RepID=UPI002D783552|nr:bacillithiol biosynthesis deacetylase BshB1 [Hymenobacter sp. GOD-10R]WRQ26174.1 bacillithiol biosynthesis deacetylase BshB1 [Hymenobacter sp. GOD-10R]